MWFKRWFPRGPSLRAWVIGQTFLTVGIIRSIPAMSCDEIGVAMLVWLGIMGGAVVTARRVLRSGKNTAVAAALMAFTSTVWATPLVYRCASIIETAATLGGWAWNIAATAAMQLVFLAMGTIVFWLAVKLEHGWRTPMWGMRRADNKPAHPQLVQESSRVLPAAKNLETLGVWSFIGGVRRRLSAILRG